MKPGKVRSIAICVFRDQGRILASEGYDAVKNQVFYRPLGGAIEFGELAADTIRREILEELGLEVMNTRYLGTIENVFTFQGQRGHEIVLVFDAEFVNQQAYRQPLLMGLEDDDPIKAYWKQLDEFSPGNTGVNPPLYPTGLYEMLTEATA